MLMRTDPFRDLDRLTQQVFGTATRPAAMPIDAYRRGEEFIVELDLPGVQPDSIDLTIEKNVLTVDGIDAFDATPVIDLKPFIPPDAPRINIKVPDWTGKMKRDE